MDSSPDDFDIPAEVFDQIAADEAAARGDTSSRGEPAPAEKGLGSTCPHCTFENDYGKPDCELCGLPL
jgi:nuclear protein localization family protein 4